MSEVSICNQALGLVGANSITALDDDQREAKLCQLNYEPVRDAVLAEHAWTFATKWLDIPAVANPSPGEFPNEFPLPPDVIAVLFVGQNYRHPENWQVENNAIRASVQTCRCQVVYQVTDTSKFSSMFTQALVARLASELAIPITNSRTLMENMYALYERKVQMAAAKDNQQGRSRRIRSTWLVNARNRSGNVSAGPVV